MPNSKTQYWLMKSEPSEFSIADLEKRGLVVWDGVRNYQVRNMFRDQMRVGDRALFYHSSCNEVGVVGEMEIVEPAVVDDTQFDKKSKYYDSKSTTLSPRWLGPKVKFVRKFDRLVPLAVIRQTPDLQAMILLRPGNRLSVFSISRTEYRHLVKMGG